MTVEEIKAKLPEAEVYTLDRNARYLIVVDRQTVSRRAVEGMIQFIPNAVFLRIDDPEGAVKLLEIKP